MDFEKISRLEKKLFFRRWVEKPLQLGAVLPSSRFLTSLVVEHVPYIPGQYIVELGAGTGTITRGLIKKGIPQEALYPVEMDEEFTVFMQNTLPKVNAICGDAGDLEALLPDHVKGNVCAVITGLPYTAIPLDVQRRIMEGAFKVLSPEGQVLQFGYNPFSAVKYKELGMERDYLGSSVLNIPPAHIWRYRLKSLPLRQVA